MVLRGLRGMGAVMYTEAGLWDSTLAKVSLRSVGEEDTTPISEVMSEGIGGGACLPRDCLIGMPL